MESRLHFHVAIMKTSHDLTLERLKQGTIYHDTVRAISLSHLTCKIGRSRAICVVRFFSFFLFFFRKCKSFRWLVESTHPSNGGRGINWKGWMGIRRWHSNSAAEKMTEIYICGRCIHPWRRVTRNCLVFRYQEIEFRLHPAPNPRAFIPNQRSPLVSTRHSALPLLLYLSSKSNRVS